MKIPRKKKDTKAVSDGNELLEVHDLDLSYIPDALREQFQEMLRKYSSMWDGSLGEIETTKHRIELVPGTRPVAQAPYCAGHNSRKIEGQEVPKMLQGRHHCTGAVKIDFTCITGSKSSWIYAILHRV